MYEANLVPLKYIAYLRKSSEQEDRQALSIGSQRDELENIATRKNLNIIQWVEESHSAKKEGRPLYTQTLERIRRKEANAILSWNPNRLSRNAVDTGDLIALIDNRLLLEVLTPQAVFHNTPFDKFMLSFACMQAKLENDNKGEDVKRGLEKKVRMGWLPSGAVIGYRNTPLKLKGYKTIEKDPGRFPLVRQMWDLMLTGNHTVTHIWEMAKDWRLTTVPRGKIGGKPMSKSGVYAMFTNPFMYGSFEFPKGSGVWINGAHEPMVTKEEFDRVQELLGRKGKPRSKKHNLPFNGLLTCSNCGGRMSGELKFKKQKNGNNHSYTFYSCKRHKDKYCKERSIEVKSLLSQTEELLEKLTISESFNHWAIKHLHEIRKNEAETQETILKKYSKEHELIVKQLDSLILNYTSPQNADRGLISDDELKNMKGSLLLKKASLEAKLSLQDKEIEEWVELTEKTFNFACYAKIWFKEGDDQTKKTVLSALGSNLLIKDRKMAVELHPYFQAILEKRDLVEEELLQFRTSKKGSTKTQKGTFVPLCPTLLRR